MSKSILPITRESITFASSQFTFMRRKIRLGEPFEEGGEREAVLEVLEVLEEMARDYLETAMVLQQERTKR